MSVNLSSIDLRPAVEDPASAVLRAEVRGFLQEERDRGSFTPRSDSWLSGYSPEFSQELGRRGWLGMTWPKRWGGHESTAFQRFVVVEELLAAGAPVAAHWLGDRQMGPAILKHGTDVQRERLLPPMTRGELFFSIGMSEPDSGSDLASVRTRARFDGGAWRLAGSKIWTSWAHRNDYVLVLCRTREQTGSNHDGLSQLIVDLRAPGVTVRPIRQLNGEHHFNEVFFDEVEVPEDMLLGEEGDGWRQVIAELAFERSGPERFLSTFPLLGELVRSCGDGTPDVAAAALGGLVARMWSIRQISMSVAAMMDQGEAPAVEAALVKDIGTLLEQDIIEVVRRAAPTVDEKLASELDHAAAHSPGFTLRGGTSEMLRGIVAKGLGL